MFKALLRVSFVSNILVFVHAQCNVLALSGGGAFGATEIGILEDRVQSGYISDKYDLITGISAGGLNAGLLSYYPTITDALPALRAVYTNLTSDDVYSFSLLDMPTKYSIYDNSPLETTITDILTQQGQSAGPQTIIGASNVNTEKLDIFEINGLGLEDKVDVLMATSSIPVVFPPRALNGSLYVDGGVISNELINQVLSQLPCDYYNVTFISASNKLGEVSKVDGFFSFYLSLIKLIYRTFDYQLARMNTTCDFPRGQINACFPTSPLLDNYGMLDFDNGEILYELGRTNNTCVVYPLC